MQVEVAPPQVGQLGYPQTARHDRGCEQVLVPSCDLKKHTHVLGAQTGSLWLSHAQLLHAAPDRVVVDHLVPHSRVEYLHQPSERLVDSDVREGALYEVLLAIA